MTPVRSIVEHLDSILDPSAYDDYGPNGLQVPGRESVETIVTGVSANVRLFSRARDAGADLVLVHHGLFWAGPPRALDRASKRRLQLLFDADMSLAAYHLPLDGHLEHGNNALLAAAIGCEGWEPFGAHKRATIGVAGRLSGEGIAPDTIPTVRTRSGGRGPLPRCGPLRHRDLRRAPARRPPRGPVRRPARVRGRAEPDLTAAPILRHGTMESSTMRPFPLLMSGPRAICAGRCKRPTGGPQPNGQSPDAHRTRTRSRP
jgi:hypothetical protein